MTTNAELEALGMDSIRMLAFWQDKTVQEANDTVGSTDRQEIKDVYNQAMLDLQTMIDKANPTTAEMIWAIKRIAEIEKQELRYHKIEMGV